MIELALSCAKEEFPHGLNGPYVVSLCTNAEPCQHVQWNSRPLQLTYYCATQIRNILPQHWTCFLYKAWPTVSEKTKHLLKTLTPSPCVYCVGTMTYPLQDKGSKIWEDIPFIIFSLRASAPKSPHSITHRWSCWTPLAESFAYITVKYTFLPSSLLLYFSWRLLNRQYHLN